MLVYTTGNGVHAFTYDPSLVFLPVPGGYEIPENGKMYSINEGTTSVSPIGVKNTSNTARRRSGHRPPVHHPLYRLSGGGFPPQPASGGIYIYPSTASHPNGKLRLLYEVQPDVIPRGTGWR